MSEIARRMKWTKGMPQFTRMLTILGENFSQEDLEEYHQLLLEEQKEIADQMPPEVLKEEQRQKLIDLVMNYDADHIVAGVDTMHIVRAQMHTAVDSSLKLLELEDCVIFSDTSKTNITKEHIECLQIFIQDMEGERWLQCYKILKVYQGGLKHLLW